MINPTIKEKALVNLDEMLRFVQDSYILQDKNISDLIQCNPLDLSSEDQFGWAVLNLSQSAKIGDYGRLEDTKKVLDRVVSSSDNAFYHYVSSLSCVLTDSPQEAVSHLKKVSQTFPLREQDQQLYDSLVSLTDVYPESISETKTEIQTSFPISETNNGSINQPKKHVVFVSTTTENTHGVPVVMNNIANQLKQNPDYEVSFITNTFDDQEIVYHTGNGQKYTFNNRKEFSEFCNQENIHFDLMHFHTWHLSDDFLPFHTDRDPMEIKEMIQELGSPKVVYTDHANPTYDQMMMELKNNVDYLNLNPMQKEEFLHQHRLTRGVSWEYVWAPTSILAKRQIMDLADIVTFVSAKQKEEEKEMIPAYPAENKDRVVYNGVDSSLYDPQEISNKAHELRNRLGLENKKIFLYAGRMDKEKGVFDLAEAIGQLQQKRQDFVTFYLGDAYSYIQEQIRELAPGAEIIFPGRISDRQELATYYAMADVVVQPTWGECFNQVIAEALAVGTPGIISDYSAPGEIYVRTGAALGCQVRNPEDLADKMNLILEDQNLATRITQTGQELVKKKLNVNQMYQDYLRIYEQLLN